MKSAHKVGNEYQCGFPGTCAVTIMMRSDSALLGEVDEILSDANSQKQPERAQ
jgi:hypothetical protein